MGSGHVWTKEEAYHFQVHSFFIRGIWPKTLTAFLSPLSTEDDSPAAYFQRSVLFQISTIFHLPTNLFYSQMVHFNLANCIARPKHQSNLYSNLASHLFNNAAPITVLENTGFQHYKDNMKCNYLFSLSPLSAFRSLSLQIYSICSMFLLLVFL